MTEELFQKFIDGLCGISERAEVEQWLDNCTAAELDGLLKKRWEIGNQPMPAEMSAELWKKLRQDIIAENVPVYNLSVRFNKKRWLAAACFIAVALCSYFLADFKKPLPNQEMATTSLAGTAKNNTGKAWTVITNEEASRKAVTLADNSEIILYRHAVLSIPADFNKMERPVYLAGTAVFSVAKDKNRPFTVFSNGIATKAIGTRFLVSNDVKTNHIDIRLFEGVIEVRSVNNSLASDTKTLHAGEEIHFGYPVVTGKNIPQLFTGNTGKTDKHASQNREEEVSFTNTPLNEVFTRMEQLYHIRIDYPKEQLTNMTLTSSFSKNDNAESLLKMIGRMHELSISKTDSSFIVTAQPKNK